MTNYTWLDREYGIDNILDLFLDDTAAHQDGNKLFTPVKIITWTSVQHIEKRIVNVGTIETPVCAYKKQMRRILEWLYSDHVVEEKFEIVAVTTNRNKSKVEEKLSELFKEGIIERYYTL